MSNKTQFLGPLASGLDTGAPATTTKSYARFATWTPITTLPSSGRVVAVLPPDGVLSEINVWKAGSFSGEALFRFGTVTNGSDNLGTVSISGNAIYRAYVNSATAQATLPFGHARVSADPTPIFFSSAAISGTTSALSSAAWVEVVYTRIQLDDRPDLVSPWKGADTTYQGPIISGAPDVGIPARNTFAYVQTVQQVTARSAPVTAQVVGVVPFGATLSELNFYVRTGVTGDAVVRFSAGTDGDNLGSIGVSAAGVYRVALTTAARTLFRGINTGSAQPVQMTIVSGNGALTSFAGVGEIVFTRRGQAEGFPGVGQKETDFQGPIGSGRNTGRFDGRVDTGWARLSKVTTTISSTNGVVSGQLVGFLPIGAALVEINYITATAAAGEALVRATTSPTVFTSDLLGSVSVSAAGYYSVIGATAPVAFGFTGVNRAVAGATAVPIYINIAATSGSIAALSGQAAIEIVYTRLDPSIYGV